jgi:hypothetical protein
MNFYGKLSVLFILDYSRVEIAVAARQRLMSCTHVQRLGRNDADVVRSARLQEVKDADNKVIFFFDKEVSADFMNNSGVIFIQGSV